MQEKNSKYFNDIRWDIINLIPVGKNRILELGCGTGNTGKVLKEQNKALEVIGIEKIPSIAESARAKLDTVITADIETFKMPFDNEYFDYVIAADILEHLYNPWLIVNTLNTYIKKGGYLIASIPNIRHWEIMKDLIFKREWNYRSDGVLDNTHLRFFTKKNMMQLFPSEYFTINRIIPKFKLQPGNRYNTLNNFTLHLFEEFLARQYIIMAQKQDKS
jgi:2-polyprenyl-3-methyl-5-hydroxy-6-metoxy-1,4-benzoquinol methylase